MKEIGKMEKKYLNFIIKDGEGLEIRANKSKYEGMFKKGKKHGFGTIKYTDN